MRMTALLILTLLLAACSPQAPEAASPSAPQQSAPASSPTAEAPQPAPEQASNPTPEAALPDTGSAEDGGAQPTMVADPQAAIPAPACTSPAAPIPAMTEGPYYTAGSPERAFLWEDGMPGTKLILRGYVLTTDCQPVANAWLDFWQADALGVYDNAGYTLRGHQFTREDGSYELTTVVPGQYPGRTEHIHFKVQAPGGEVVTSQLYFPGAAANETDRIFDPALVIKIVEEGSTVLAEFNIVIP